MQEFLQQLINGLSIGSIYALIAVGYTMVYGILQLINFAHGDVFMVGALLTLTISRKFGFFAPPHVTQSLTAFLLCATLAVLACAVLGLVIERFAYRPLRNRPRINSLITAIGISLLLEFGGQHPHVFGPTPQAFPTAMIPWVEQSLFAGSALRVSRIDALILVTTLVLMLVLSFI